MYRKVFVSIDYKNSTLTDVQFHKYNIMNYTQLVPIAQNSTHM